jgi:hypothetical protein
VPVFTGEIYQIIRTAIRADNFPCAESHLDDAPAGTASEEIFLEMHRTAVDNQAFSLDKKLRTLPSR